ncbi:MAG: alpha/beta fold hydrolase [Planctomycetes bacterium]|nr:alpha/beta fold hydrolase [Planctomycetota bacterium]
MRRSFLLTAVLLTALVVARAITASAAEPREAKKTKSPFGLFGFKPSSTRGGTQFWADELFLRDWHIQRNALTGHCRLLDGNNKRHAWGTFAHCIAKLDEIKKEQKLKPYTGKAVICLHGLGRGPASMKKMKTFLQKDGTYVVYNVAYPTTQAGVGDHAKKLDAIIRNLKGVEEINFVAHSLGNLVIRHYLADQTDEARGLKPDRRIKRIVMLGPPNHGAQLAKKYGKNWAWQAVAGIPGQQLGRDWDKLEKKLVTPHCQFGIIAGGKGKDGYNPLLAGDDDGVVRVEEAKLAGARDFAVAPVVHMFLKDDAKVQEQTLRFLKQGHFISEEQRRPIVAKGK